MATTTQKLRYVQLADHLRALIASGELKAGDRLPSYTELHRQFGVAAATTQRVYDELEKESLVERRSGSGIYVADASQSAPKQTNTIGLLVHSHYWGDKDGILYIPSQAMLAGIREACRESNKEILLIDDKDTIRAGKMDGIIIYSDKLELYSLGISPDLPQVLIGQQADDIACVKMDDFAGGKLATIHLIERGHRRIACLMEGVFDETLQRIAGYQAALQQAGIAGEESRVKRITAKINISPSFGYLEWGRQQMSEWLQDDWHQLGCTAIVVQNDQAAIGVMQVLQEVGIKVPDDVSVVGFDGTKMCDLVRPRLASIQVPYYQMGYEAVKVLLAQAEQAPQKRVPTTTTLPVHLREGQSSKILIKEKNHARV